MKALVLGDIHGNLIALEKVIKEFGKEVDQIICHGDVVNYGPWSNECVELLQDKNSFCLKGNHEEAYLNGFYPGKNPLVHHFFNQTFPKFKHINIIAGYATKMSVDSFDIVHTLNDRYYYPDSDLSQLVLEKDTIIGHSHYAFNRQTKNGKQLINTGSVGQNRVNLAIIDFVIVDFEKNTVEMKQLSYDPQFLISEMKKEAYPKECLSYYLSKLS